MFGRSSRDGARAALAGAASAADGAAHAAAVDESGVADGAGAAFFDCDNTVIAGASTYYFARGLVARKFVTSQDLATFAWQQVRFRASGREHHGQLLSARAAALDFVAGRDVAQIEAIAAEVWEELLAGKVYSGTRALAQEHLDAGRQVWLVTAAPAELARVIARGLGLTGALGTVAESVDGVYTGRLLGEPIHGAAKAEAVRALAGREGLDLARCWAYSDSVNDVPMLTLVGRPTVVNGDPDLRRVAKERGWPTREFRTARRVARVGVPTAGGLGMLAGAVLAGTALRRSPRPPSRRAQRGSLPRRLRP